jgi:hypothetical protein
MKKIILSALVATLGSQIPIICFGGEMTARQIYQSSSGQTQLILGPSPSLGPTLPPIPAHAVPAAPSTAPVEPAKPPKPSKPEGAGAQAQPSSQTTQTAYTGIKFWVNVVTASGREEVSTIKRIFHSGEKLRLSFRPNNTGYLYVYNKGSSGKTRLLYPAQGDNNQVQRDSVVRIPSDQQNWLRMDAQPGQEELVVVMTQKPLSNIVPVIPLSASQISAGVTQPTTEIPTAQFDASLSKVVARDMLVQHDDKPSDGKPPASYVVAPNSQLENGKVISVSIKLKHQ